MIFIFDNMVASIIVATLFFALAATQLRVQETGIAQVSSHAAKTKALTLGQWLDEDIISLGEDIPDNSARFDEPSTSTFDIYRLNDEGDAEAATVTYTTEWRFYSDAIVGGVQQRRATRYWTVPVDSIEVEVGDETYWHPLFQLHRAVSPWGALAPTLALAPSAFTEDGRSASTLSLFRIQLLDNEGDPFPAGYIDVADEASYVRVDFSMVPEFELSRNYLRELYWSTTLKVRPFWG
jgi:hypothetical protein